MSAKTSSKRSPTPQRREVSLVIAPAALEVSAIESVIRGWIVPLLVKDFLSEHRCRVAEFEAKCSNPTTELMGMEDVAIGHIK